MEQSFLALSLQDMITLNFRYFEELAECIVNDLKHDMLYCDVEEMKRSISDKFSEWSYVYNWNYYDDCQGMLAAGIHRFR